ncbi:MAG: hypothetical protein DWQ05_11370 [Calditrichaeota bacterium]|nr:MAG: hypothetical protein DWQ05_11370 [Calditrichota bacterium]
MAVNQLAFLQGKSPFVISVSFAFIRSEALTLFLQISKYYIKIRKRKNAGISIVTIKTYETPGLPGAQTGVTLIGDLLL